MNTVTLIEVVQHFETKTEEKRIPKNPKDSRTPDPGWKSWYSTKETETEWVFTRSEEEKNKPYYTARLSSLVNAGYMSYGSEARYGSAYVGPKAQTPRQAVMALLDSMALAEKCATL